MPVVAVSFTAVRLSRAGLQAASTGGIGVLIVVFMIVFVVMIMVVVMNGCGGGKGSARGRDDARLSGPGTLAVPGVRPCFSITRNPRGMRGTCTGTNYSPMIAVRLAAVRLSRGRGECLGLTQRRGNKCHKGCGICSNLHFEHCLMLLHAGQNVESGFLNADIAWVGMTNICM